MATEIEQTESEDLPVVAQYGYPPQYYFITKTSFLPPARFMKEDSRSRISKDITKATAGLVAQIEAKTAGHPPGPPTPPVAGSGSSEDNGRMEARIRALETDMKDVRERLVRVDIKVDGLDKRMDGFDSRMDRLEKKVDSLPSRDFVESKVSASANKIILWVVSAIVLVQIVPQIPGLFRAIGP